MVSRILGAPDIGSLKDSLKNLRAPNVLFMKWFKESQGSQTVYFPNSLKNLRDSRRLIFKRQFKESQGFRRFILETV
ncbi:hypothetical protein Zmor_027400 [Zophobas morio]|uniref:Uncharacterized protein n=1 Tax=Zophobas morio TaxID=2755281 RepID=A0AA38M218_9CUCU|nr:hypothetical protein Zmor_027400 [Zophobas morio]